MILDWRDSKIQLTLQDVSRHLLAHILMLLLLKFARSKVGDVSGERAEI